MSFAFQGWKGPKWAPGASIFALERLDGVRV